MTRSMKMLAAGALALALVPALGGAASAPNVADQVATKQTITDIRSVGTAMYTWYKDQATGDEKPGAAMIKAVDISAIPVISREDLAAVLVPRYIARIPEKDGWGNAYEFRLETGKLKGGKAVMGLRSAGRDGVFSGETYEIGGFPLDQFDQDIPWVDGFFVRWPDPKAQAQ